MFEKRVPPLKNPPSEKSATVTAFGKSRSLEPISDSNKDDERGLPRGEKRVRWAEALVSCEMCGWLQKIVFTIGKLPNYHRCINCGELQPTDAYRVFMYGLGLPRPLSPREVKERKLLFKREKEEVQ